MRSFIIAGNWKMNGGPAEARELLTSLKNRFDGKKALSELVVFPPFVSLRLAGSLLKGTIFRTGAQNVHFEDNGAYTGEISVSMLKECGCRYVLAGHSERRQYFSESDQIIARKVKKAIGEGLNVILCVGEKLEERSTGRHEEVVSEQLRAVISSLPVEQATHLTIAYEPVWAIGTGETATPGQAQKMHHFIRTLIASHWSSEQSTSIRILYGGSMKPGNAEELLSQDDVDGGLIGGASLNADSFSEIIEIAEKLEPQS